jgi:hypothetical protein
LSKRKAHLNLALHRNQTRIDLPQRRKGAKEKKISLPNFASWRSFDFAQDMLGARMTQTGAFSVSLVQDKNSATAFAKASGSS